MSRESIPGAIERKLKAPLRRKLELIEELGADAVALQEELERRGYDARTARRIAAGRVQPSGEVLAELEVQYAPRLGHWIREAGLTRSVERLGAAATAILAGAAMLAALWWQAPDATSSLLGWSLVVVVALLSSNWARAAKGLWVDGDLPPEPRRVLWARQTGLMATAAALGGLGTAWEGYLAFGALEETPGAVWTAIRHAVFFGAAGLGVAALGALGWLAFVPRLVRDETLEYRIATSLGRLQPLRVFQTDEVGQ